MRMFHRCTSVVAAWACFLCLCLWSQGRANAKDAPSFTVGMTVAAKWSGEQYYLAVIKTAKDDKFDVEYADGTKGAVTSAEMKVIPATLTLAKGDKVLAVWSGAKFYPGTVEEAKATGALVKWDDGSAPSEVAFGKIMKPANADANGAASAVVGSFAVGATAAAKWTDGKYYLAVIKAVNGDKYDVDYADGTKGTVTPADMKIIPSTLTLSKGDKVLAVWSTSGRFYTGIVEEVKATGARIKWDDGTAPSEAPFGKIIK